MCHTQSPYLLLYALSRHPSAEDTLDNSSFWVGDLRLSYFFFTLGKELFPGYTVSKWQTLVTAA